MTQTQNLQDMFSPSPNGEGVLNIDAITTLIRWAEGDEALAERFGTWDQGHWAKVIVGESVGEYGEDLDPVDLEEGKRNGHCKTAYCMAGQAVVQAGYRLLYSIDYEEDGIASASHCVKQRQTGEVNRLGLPEMEDVEGTQSYISDVARVILGLEYGEATAFFDGDNRVMDLKYLTNQFLDHRGLPPVYEGVDEHCYGASHYLGYENDED